MKEERYQKILEVVNTRGFASAKDLARELYVSAPTIRRDLADLAANGLVVRCHGGVGALPDGHMLLPYDMRYHVGNDRKKALCHVAAREVHDGDVVFVDVSTTLSYLPEFLAKRHGITVVTNSSPIAVDCAKHNIRTFCTGGEVFRYAQGYVGTFAEQFLRNFRFDVAFFSVHGISEDGMADDTAVEMNCVRKTVMNASARNVLVLDCEKFNVSAPFPLARANEFDRVVTNGTVPEAYGISPDKIAVV